MCAAIESEKVLQTFISAKQERFCDGVFLTSDVYFLCICLVIHAVGSLCTMNGLLHSCFAFKSDLQGKCCITD